MLGVSQGIKDVEATAHVGQRHAILPARSVVVHGLRQEPDMQPAYESVPMVAPNGIMGDPRWATREMGEALLEHVSDVMARDLRARLALLPA